MPKPKIRAERFTWRADDLTITDENGKPVELSKPKPKPKNA